METPVLDGLTGASDGGPRMAAWASTNNSRGIGREGQVCVQMYGAYREQPSRRDRLLMQLRIGRTRCLRLHA